MNYFIFGPEKTCVATNATRDLSDLNASKFFSEEMVHQKKIGFLNSN